MKLYNIINGLHLLITAERIGGNVHQRHAIVVANKLTLRYLADERKP